MKEIKVGCYYYTSSNGEVVEYTVTGLPTECHPEECYCKIGSDPRTHYIKTHKLMTGQVAYDAASRIIELEMSQGRNILKTAEDKMAKLNTVCKSMVT